MRGGGGEIGEGNEERDIMSSYKISHRDEKSSIGNVVSSTVIRSHGDWTHPAEFRVTCRIVESMCCTPETSITLYVNYNNKSKNKFKNAHSTNRANECQLLFLGVGVVSDMRGYPVSRSANRD